MKTLNTLLLLPAFIICLLYQPLTAQNNWSLGSAQPFTNRVDDVFMLNSRLGYAVCGDGKITKTTNSGHNWKVLAKDSSVYYRSVEFIDEQKGFVGGFSRNSKTDNIFLRTNDGGTTWTDLTALLHPKAQEGICGLAVADPNTIYGCGNWFRDSAYIVKSSDGGNTWSFIDMHEHASSLIDMYFLNKDTGFATGRSPKPLRTAVILYTVDGGVTWTNQFTDVTANEYCWKIQRLNSRNWYASIEDFGPALPRILKSADGGMTWNVYTVSDVEYDYNIEGIGFIDSLTGWTGGGFTHSFKTTDGGITWTRDSICPGMNRVFRVHDSLLFAAGAQVWRFGPENTDTTYTGLPGRQPVYTGLTCYPNPAHGALNLQATLHVPTYMVISLCNSEGKLVREIENNLKPQGTHSYRINTETLPPGLYYVVMKTHESDNFIKISIQ